MFEYLKSYRVIVVSGPQRSGTTICTRMIATDTGHQFVPEEGFGFYNIRLWRYMVEKKHNLAIQCPTMSRWIHEFGELEDVAIVWMLRPLDEILASQERINWTATYQRKELLNYGPEAQPPIALVKLNYWQTVQKPVIRHAYEVEYHSLETHPLWVSSEQRKKFRPRQIRSL